MKRKNKRKENKKKKNKRRENEKKSMFSFLLFCWIEKWEKRKYKYVEMTFMLLSFIISKSN